ncbi:Peptidase_S24 domain-containing protein, partial [Cephalotus follicularis]
MKILSYMSRSWRTLATEALNRTSQVVNFVCLLHVTNTYIVSSTLVYGSSMLPTLNMSGDVVLAEHVSHRLGKVGHGDVVLVRSPQDPRKIVTKRIVAMEGDRVPILVDPTTTTHRFPFVEVPKGHVWIQGDNMYSSTDSRHYGPVPYGLIQGKVFLRVWPPYSFGSL